MDVDIEGLGIELARMPNIQDIDIELQCQFRCLDAHVFGLWNPREKTIPNLVCLVKR